MNIVIIVPPSFEPFTGESKIITVMGGTVGECLEELAVKYPVLRPRIFNKTGKLLKGLCIFINKDAAYPGELDRPVHEGDKIYISYIVMGG